MKKFNLYNSFSLFLLFINIFLVGCNIPREQSTQNQDVDSSDSPVITSANSCQGSRSQSCDIFGDSNDKKIGEGTRFRVCSNGIWSDFGRCEAESCSSGYALVEDQCVAATCSGSTTQRCEVSSNGLVIGSGTQSRTCNSGIWSSFGRCEIDSCSSGYVLSNNQCVAATCSGSSTQACNVSVGGVVVGSGTQTRTCNLGTWSSFGSCQVQSCSSGYVLSNNQCVAATCSGSSTQACNVSVGGVVVGSGTQTRTCNLGTWSSFGSCQVQSCSSGYVLSNNQCVAATCSGSSTQACNVSVGGVVVGSGTQTRTCNLGTWSSFGSCQAQSCNSGYTLSNNQCVAATCSGSSTQACNVSVGGVVVGSGTQTRTCNLGTWSSFGSCQAQSCNSGYTLSNNQCVLILLNKTVRLKNLRSHGRSQFAHVSVPFEKGEVSTKSDLDNWGPGSDKIQWKVLKWHFENGQKHSVAIGGLKFKTSLSANEEKFIDINQQNLATLPASHFELGPNLSALTNGSFSGSNLANQMFVEVKLANDSTIYTAPVFGTERVLESGPVHMGVVYRNSIPGTALSVTSTLDFFHQQDFGEMVFQIGNNDFNNPNPGHVQVEFVDILYRLPFKFELRRQGAYGVSSAVTTSSEVFEKVRLFSNTLLHDGTSRSFRGNWSAILPSQVGTIYRSSSIAQRFDPLFGVVDMDSWDKSKAAGIVGNILPLRDTVGATRSLVESIYEPTYGVRPNDYSPILNKNPSISGDQPDFSSNMPAIQQYAIQSGSGKLLQYLLHGSAAEENRPTFLYFNGRRMRHSDTPRTCFWWSGAIHWYQSHNSGTCNQWMNRIGLNYDNNNGWRGYDDQHYGSPHTRALYEMTGDTWTGDILEYRMSYALWNKLGENATQIFNRVGAERSIRLLEDALQLYVLMPDAHEAAYLMDRLKVGSKTFVDGKQNPNYPYASWGWKQFQNAFGVAIIETVFNDSRYPNCMGVNSATGLDNICGVGWMTGFHLGYHATMYRHGFETVLSKETIHAYMDSRNFFFHPDGRNFKARRFYDLNFGPLMSISFTSSWFSGWIMAVREAGQDHPDKDWFNNSFIPYMYNNAYSVLPDGIRGTSDKWYQ